MSSLLSNVWIQAKSKNQKILICLIYREFNDLTGKGQMSVDLQLERLKIFSLQIEQASKEGLVLIMGDMNIDVTKYGDPSY